MFAKTLPTRHQDVMCYGLNVCGCVLSSKELPTLVYYNTSLTVKGGGMEEELIDMLTYGRYLVGLGLPLGDRE